MKIDIRHMVLTISNAVDLVGVSDVFHGRRVAMMAAECAKALAWDRATQLQLFEGGLLHDCGVSSTREHHSLIQQFEWCGNNSHCETGHALLMAFPPLAHLAPIVRYHHSRWEDMAQLHVDPMVASQANLIHLVDRVDAWATPYYRDESLLLHVAEIRDLVHIHRNSIFAAELVDAFLAASATEAFWLQLDPAYIPQYVDEMEEHQTPRCGTMQDLKQFAYLIARIVDAKSHFTAQHSLGVARLARFLAQLCGMSGEHLEKLEIAALMHDIGKLQVPDEILESPGGYSPLERAVMKKHSFATYQILRRVAGFEELAKWAAQHHESLNGGGYPFHLKADEISLEARIIRVADVFQALAQQRPYREPMPLPEILGWLRKMQADNEVDSAIVDLVAQYDKQCHAVALDEFGDASSVNLSQRAQPAPQ
jgi:putative nucleotidyltransferase with HDIG domain